MCTHCLVGTVQIGVVHDEHFREVVLALAHTEQFGFDERQSGVAPACTGAVLVFDGCDGVFLHGGEDETFFFRSVLCQGIYAQQTQCGNQY